MLISANGFGRTLGRRNDLAATPRRDGESLNGDLIYDAASPTHSPLASSTLVQAAFKPYKHQTLLRIIPRDRDEIQRYLRDYRELSTVAVPISITTARTTSDADEGYVH
ncbi:hypothetical protein CDV31_007833 [Fusarium ambrosium]|uniref:Uncharacterized protein n=1 Tax=Fusarium ambrosium TaxID=131363 RepID=A0A428U4B9_9HYPO|nr:hypothetical protein CDV31_007833 [Fusarium ambrosium]